ncbi:uncharacterized protein LOC135196867 [Macrobrachium nipponense]|uniref:uncharacterized protein LOC135196867 n=1 Tax=Macrobrachium nipponense TaxID=159736 RepID=UPI0030C80F78
MKMTHLGDHSSPSVPLRPPSCHSSPFSLYATWHSPWGLSRHGVSLSTSRSQWSAKHRQLFFCLILVLLKTTGVLGMRVKQVIVPQPAIVGQSAKLQCLWESTDKQVYSIRWYINNKQFYSYIIGSAPEKIKHKIEGVDVDLLESNETSVTLRDVTPLYEGEYRCELMSEGPSFESSFLSTNLTVVNPPNTPEISGFRPNYRIPDTLKVNCTTHNSRPEALISFYVNGRIIHQDSGRVTELGVVKHKYLETFTSSSQLTLPLSSKYVPKLTLTCRAQVKGFDIKAETSETATVSQYSFFPFFSRGTTNSSYASQVLLASAALVMLQILQAPW